MKLARRRPGPLATGGRWHVHADGTAHCHPGEHDAAGVHEVGHAEHAESPRGGRAGAGGAGGDGSPGRKAPR